MTELLPWQLAALAGVAGLLVGLGLQYLMNRTRILSLEKDLVARDAELSNARARDEEREAVLEQTSAKLEATFGKLVGDSLQQSNETFLQLASQKMQVHEERAKTDLGERHKAVEDLVKPLHEALERANRQIADIEKTRQEAYGSIREQLQAMGSGQNELRQETRNLVNALRRPEVRGQWGELTLRRLAELAGMVEHCDFIEQEHINTDEGGAIRPDMIIKLPERGQLVVDVKTPLDAYLTAVEATDPDTQKAALVSHARNVQNRVRELSKKSYWNQFERSPEFVILFIPGDQFLTAALNENPSIIEDALNQKVLLATPTSFVGILRTIAFGWRQLSLADNAEQIRQLGEDLHNRLSVFTGHLGKLGRQLESSVKAYNASVGSLESKVLPGARKFGELGIAGKKPIDSLEQLDATARTPALQIDAQPEALHPASDNDNDND